MGRLEVPTGFVAVLDEVVVGILGTVMRANESSRVLAGPRFLRNDPCSQFEIAIVPVLMMPSQWPNNTKTTASTTATTGKMTLATLSCVSFMVVLPYP